MTKKGFSTIYSMIFLIIIMLIVMSIVLNATLDITDKYQEKHNYEIMLNNIYDLDIRINQVAENKNNFLKININNSEYLEIDCVDNRVYGYVQYNQNYVEEEKSIRDIITYKNINNVYFIKDYNGSLINLTCYNDDENNEKILILNKGKNILDLNYTSFDGNININISRN